jgi:hypothetical protein
MRRSLPNSRIDSRAPFFARAESPATSTTNGSVNRLRISNGPPGAGSSVSRTGREPPRALDELLADDPLEGNDLLADARLGVVQVRSGVVERAVLSNRFEREKIAQRQTGPLSDAVEGLASHRP